MVSYSACEYLTGRSVVFVNLIKQDTALISIGNGLHIKHGHTRALFILIKVQRKKQQRDRSGEIALLSHMQKRDYAVSTNKMQTFAVNQDHQVKCYSA